MGLLVSAVSCSVPHPELDRRRTRASRAILRLTGFSYPDFSAWVLAAASKFCQS